ncbi:hypothetical protein LDVICp164 [lymphocystis disease virus-China]|uniref:Uncharacterized protein n=1 Tax=lymphocystis disease virus-China TaxID=256729 RepID=Q677U8_9VIRU|nr:hypothetical protein LDVICp164 [lymphocystis disease virus-China]AAU11009.1 hypothetical protein [lymphocystis disease virus-China]
MNPLIPKASSTMQNVIESVELKDIYPLTPKLYTRSLCSYSLKVKGLLYTSIMLCIINNALEVKRLFLHCY